MARGGGGGDGGGEGEGGCGGGGEGEGDGKDKGRSEDGGKMGLLYSLSAQTSPDSTVDASGAVDTSGAVNNVGEGTLVMAGLEMVGKTRRREKKILGENRCGRRRAAIYLELEWTPAGRSDAGRWGWRLGERRGVFVVSWDASGGLLGWGWGRLLLGQDRHSGDRMDQFHTLKIHPGEICCFESLPP